MKKYTYKIIGIDCFACAKKIEDELNKNKSLQNVILNFATSKISYETSNLSFQEINKIIDKIEPGARMIIEENKKEYHFLALIIGFGLGLLGTLLNFKYHELIIYLSYLILLYNPFLKALKMLIKSKTINENFLIVVSAIGALLIHSEMEGIMVLSLYLLGKILEEKAVNKTRDSIYELLSLQDDYASLKVKDKIKKVKVENVKIGDILCVKKGEKVAIDGVLVSKEAFFDTSSLTGESEHLQILENQQVLSGYVNLSDVIYIKTTNLFVNSTVSKILNLVEEASNNKSQVETTVSKLTKIYTPVILILAILVLLFSPFLLKISYHDALYRALSFLVISCPCAIAISVPLSYFTGIGVSSLNGILIKGSNYLDNLSKIKKIIFDKTGTLTTGAFKVLKIEIFDKNYTEESLINIMKSGEVYSNHPIAKSIMKLNAKKNPEEIKDYKELSGLGISYKYKNHIVKIGNRKICEDDCNANAILHLNIDNKHVASIYIDDGIKEFADDAIKDIKNFGIKTYMFTGDKKEVALEIAKKLTIDKVYYELLPDQKYEKYLKISNPKEVIAYVGDGINDSLVLKKATIGISMGDVGSDIANLASDIVIANDDLRKIPLGIKISKYVNLIIKENLIFALTVKLLVLILSTLGLSSMWVAVFADTGVTVLTILNTLRIISAFKVKKIKENN